MFAFATASASPWRWSKLTDHSSDAKPAFSGWPTCSKRGPTQRPELPELD
jgi:hypothetical protein